MKKLLKISFLILMGFALAAAGFAKSSGGSSGAHGSKPSKNSKSHAPHKSHHHSIAKVQKVEHPRDDGPPAGWH